MKRLSRFLLASGTGSDEKDIAYIRREPRGAEGAELIVLEIEIENFSAMTAAEMSVIAWIAVTIVAPPVSKALLHYQNKTKIKKEA